MKNIVAFCMRCFANSAVPVDEETNFCHNCGGEGTCIAIKNDEADYLRENIQYVIDRAKTNSTKENTCSPEKCKTCNNGVGCWTR